MLKKLKILLGAVCLILLCAGLAACKKENPMDKYDVLVYYDANGGTFQGQSGITVIDGFCYDDYQADENGDYHFKLLDPLSGSRPGNITLTKPKSFLAGWYKTRTEHLDEDGNFVDEQGRSLVSVDGVYYVKGTEDKENADERVISEPYYTYSDRWDFESDVLDCNAQDGESEIRLYAGWVPYYSFEYYYKQDGVWTNFGSTDVNYGAASQGGINEDLDTIWVPDWKDGVMNHTYNYKNGRDSYTFPSLAGYTFKAAYLDEECTDKIEVSTKHKGTLDREHAKAVDSVQNIYVEFEEGVRYRIEKAEQLASNVNISAHYEILNDLEFNETIKWPSAFTGAEFTGSFVAADSDGKVTIKGISTNFNNSSATGGGLFGRIGAGAEVKGITFEEADIKVTVGFRQNCSIGLFAGEIDEAAQVEDVIVSGSIGLGKLSSIPELNLLVGGDNKEGVGVGAEGIKLYASGEKMLAGRDEQNNFLYKYNYSVDIDAVIVDEASGDVTLSLPQDSASGNRDNETTDIYTWRKQNG